MKTTTLQKKGYTLREAIFLPLILIAFFGFFGMVILSGLENKIAAGVLLFIISCIIIFIGLTEKSPSFNIFIRGYYLLIGGALMTPFVFTYLF